MTTVTKMRLSKETYTFLKNFSEINSNILIKPGNVIKTVSPQKNTYAEAKVQEEFETEISIWDLNKFLGIVSMFANPDLEFNENYVDISNGRSSVRYYYSEPELLTVPTKDFKMPPVLVSFDLDENDLNEILKASRILQVSDVQILGEDGVLKIIVNDETNDTSNSFTVIIDENYNGPDYDGMLNVSEIKFVPGSYSVSLTETVITKFSHKTQNLTYYIGTKRG
jgi:hypothetical protein